MADGTQRMGTVKEVNMSNHRVVVEDDYGTFLYISLQLHDPVVAIPVPGERWIIEQQGIDWFLEKRVEDGTESQAITALRPGDRRIEASGNLYLAGQNVFVNGTSLNTEAESLAPKVDSDRIIAPMNTFFQETTLTLTSGTRIISRFTTDDDFSFTRIRYMVSTGGASSDFIDVGVLDSNFNPVVNSGPIECAITGVRRAVFPQTILPGNRVWYVGLAYSGGGTLVVGVTNLVSAGVSTYGGLMQDGIFTTIRDSHALGGMATNGYPFSNPVPMIGYSLASTLPIMALLP